MSPVFLNCNFSEQVLLYQFIDTLRGIEILRDDILNTYLDIIFLIDGSDERDDIEGIEYASGNK